MAINREMGRCRVMAVALAAIALLGAGGMVGAGPADYLRLAPASHEFFAYIDVAQALGSKVYADVKADVLDANAQMQLDKIGQFLGMRFPEDIEIVALTAKISQKDEGCALIRGKWNRSHIETLFALNAAYTEIVKPSGKIIGYFDDSKRAMSYFSFLRDDLVAVGNKAAVEAVVDTCAGQAPSLAADPQMLALTADAGTSPLAMVVARRPQTLPPDLAKVPVAGKLRSALLALTCGPDAMTITARIEAESLEIATRCLEMARGLIALGQIQEQSPRLAQVAKASAATQKGNVVEWTVRVDLASAEALIRQSAAERRSRGANFGGRRAP